MKYWLISAALASLGVLPGDTDRKPSSIPESSCTSCTLTYCEETGLPRRARSQKHPDTYRAFRDGEIELAGTCCVSSERRFPPSTQSLLAVGICAYYKYGHLADLRFIYSCCNVLIVRKWPFLNIIVSNADFCDPARIRARRCHVTLKREVCVWICKQEMTSGVRSMTCTIGGLHNVHIPLIQQSECACT